MSERDVDMGHDVHLGPDGQPRIIERRFVVDDNFAGERLDQFLKRQIPRLSRTRLQRILQTSLSRADGRPFKAHTRVAAGDEYILRVPARPEPPCPRTFDVLHEDPDFYVIDKPAGLPVHASAKFYFNTLTRVLAERFPDERTQIAHRIDRETSGCLVVARNKEAGAALKTSFLHKVITKHYVAIVRGQPPEAWDHDVELAYPLGLVDPEGDAVDVRMEVRADGLEARTIVRVLRRCGDRALVRCSPVTGRQHQIRAHLAAAGFPIAGDKLYAHGDDAFSAFCEHGLTPELLALFELPRQALHAASITFPHPRTREAITVEAPLPADMASYLESQANKI